MHLLITNQLQKQSGYFIVALLALVSVSMSFILGVMYLILPNALASYWGRYNMLKKTTITKIDFLNMYIIKIAILGLQSTIISQLALNWSMFTSGMLAALIAICVYPILVRESL
ncbi:hypothetical protein OAT84_00495 [Gammaproteobacteria bacterium]|nr:hypothetical protein [Gammaproteobacteria bacterium]